MRAWWKNWGLLVMGMATLAALLAFGISAALGGKRIEPADDTARYFTRYDVQEGACFVAYRAGAIAMDCIQFKPAAAPAAPAGKKAKR